MGLFDFIKKKKETPKTPKPVQTSEKKDDLPPIEGIPIPPSEEQKESGTKPETIADIPKTTPEEATTETVAEPEKIETPITTPETASKEPTTETKPCTEEKKLEEKFFVPKELKEAKAEKPKEEEKKIVPTPGTEKKTTGEEDFSLPEFTEEDIQISDVTTEEEKKPIKPIEKIAETIQTKSVSPTIEISPLLKTETKEEKITRYANIEQCKNIFEKINLNQKTLSNIREFLELQKKDNTHKKIVQTYKNLHDDFNLIQERLMEIDSSLFER